MPNLQPLNLTSPEWEKQEGESNRHYFFAGLFIRSDETVEEFHSRMNEEYVTNGKEGFLDYAPYSLHYFRELCTAHKWIARRELKKTHELDKMFNEMDVIENDRKIERFKLKENIEFEALEKLEDKVKFDEKLTGGQFKDFTQGVRNLQDSRNIDREKPTDYSKQKVEAELKAGVETNMKIEDNSALAEVQTMFMQPEFIEMNRKLMNKTADELQRRRNSNE
ncbi:MAG: hypothetical protein J6T69_07120 [Methanobrevibacter sp.]|nr:hypothetical protein [Methanobrevibacter sp.]